MRRVSQSNALVFSQIKTEVALTKQQMQMHESLEICAKKTGKTPEQLVMGILTEWMEVTGSILLAS